jgi:hypothetical protein
MTNDLWVMEDSGQKRGSVCVSPSVLVARHTTWTGLKTQVQADFPAESNWIEDGSKALALNSER